MLNMHVGTVSTEAPFVNPFEKKYFHLCTHGPTNIKNQIRYGQNDSIKRQITSN